MAYRLLFIRCGKPRCHCMRGSRGHGPYWYEEWRDGDRVRTRYVGKKRFDRHRDEKGGQRREPPPGRSGMKIAAALRVLGFSSMPGPLRLMERYRTLAKQHHLDVGGDNETMASINEAYRAVKREVMPV